MIITVTPLGAYLILQYINMLKCETRVSEIWVTELDFVVYCSWDLHQQYNY